MGVKINITIEEIRKQFNDRGYILLADEYINGTTEMNYICKKHEDKGILHISYKTFKKGFGCRFCGYEKQLETKRKNKAEGKHKTTKTIIKGRWSYSDVKEYIEVISESDCKLLTDEINYKNTNTKIAITCEACGEPFDTTFNDFLHENRRMCKRCSKQAVGDNYRATYEEVKEYIENEGYKLLSNTYVNHRTKLDMVCPEGHDVHMDYGKFKYRGHRCHVCNGGVRYTLEQVREKIESEPGYKLKSDYYYNFMTDLVVECDEGHEYHTYLQNWDTGARCTICNESGEERRIRDWLEKNNANFMGQYKFDDLKGIGGNALKYDFAVLDNENKPKIIIEYDGIFHFENKFKDDYRFNLTQTHDKIKNEYCDKNNIPLIRIPYWEDYRLEIILEEKVKPLI